MMPCDRTDIYWTNRHIRRWTDAQAATMVRTGHSCANCVGCGTLTPRKDGRPDPETICSAWKRRRS